MKRRTLLKAISSLGVIPALSYSGLSRGIVDGGHEGPLLLQIHAEGGWDVTSYCDPKVNQPGERPITTWSETLDPVRVGGVEFAPFANNQWFVEKYHQQMLVINGVDLQTNSHTTGILHNWSGRNAAGYPALTALFAAHYAPTAPMSYVNFGGFGSTENLISYTKLQGDPAGIAEIVEPNLQGRLIDNPDYEDGHPIYFRQPAELSLIEAHRQARLQRLQARGQLAPREAANLRAFSEATRARGPLKDFADYLPKAEEIFARDETTHNNLKAQVQVASSAFAAGVACAADVQMGGFDTHDDHDALHKPLVQLLNESIDLIWTLAETAGYADRLTVVVGSDFSRTPEYNSQQGKDHWPIGSVMVMQKAPSWGSRVVGLTDERQNAIAIDPVSLQADPSRGAIIYPKDVHEQLRQLLGLADSPLAARFPFNSGSGFRFFGDLS